MLREHLAQHADRAHVEILRRAAVGRAQAMPQQPRLAEPAHQLAAAPVHVRALGRVRAVVEARRRPAIRLGREPAMLLAEEWPLHAVVVVAHQSPSNTGFCFAANAS